MMACSDVDLRAGRDFFQFSAGTLIVVYGRRTFWLYWMAACRRGTALPGIHPNPVDAPCLEECPV